MTYQDFLDQKLHAGAAHGFEPIWMPPQLFDFQQSLVTWAIRKGRAAIFADCGLGKTAMQLTWAENVVRHTNKPVLILTPLRLLRRPSERVRSSALSVTAAAMAPCRAAL
jgi:ERCC4-related helicase